MFILPGEGRAFGGSDNLPVDDPNDGYQVLDEVNEDDNDGKT